MWESEPPPVELVRSAPEPAHLWIEASPRWRGRSDAPWIDLRSLDLGGTARVTGRRFRSSDASPGAVYLPAHQPERIADARAISAWARNIGATVVDHMLAGAPEIAGEPERIGDPATVAPPAEELTGKHTPLLDLLPILLSRDWGQLEELPQASIVVWPLLARLSDDPGLVREGLEHLKGLGARTVLPIAPTLEPRARRLLSEHVGEAAFDRVFHSGTADPREFAFECLACGLDYLPSRPLAVQGPRVFERRLAAELALIADLSLEVEGSEPAAQVFFRAARWFETTDRDVRSLWREGNLGVLPWIDGAIESVVAELTAGAERSSLLERLAHDWPRPAP